MVTMPGTPVEEAWSPEGEGDRARIANAKMPADYKPEMGIQGAPAENPYKPFTADTDRAQMLTQQDPGWQERFVQHFRNAQQYGTPGVYELTQIRDAENGYVNGQAVGKEAGVLSADQIRQERADRQMAYEGMKPADSFGDYVAAVGGEVAGAVADPASLLQAPVKIGSVGWRAAWPMLSRMLDSSVSNAAMNVAINGVVQAEEAGAGLRDQVDWLSLATDAGAGAIFGAPFGAIKGRAAARETAAAAPPPATPKGASEFYAAEAQPPAPQPPAPQPAEPVPPVQGLEVPTPAQLQAEHSSQDLAAAQEALFGEVVGTRNLTPEQTARLDDYLNGSKPGDIPQAPPETQGGLDNQTPGVTYTHQTFTIDNPIEGGGPRQATLSIGSDGSGFITRPDGTRSDVSAMVQAGAPPERMIALIEQGGGEADYSKIHTQAPGETQGSPEYQPPETTSAIPDSVLSIFPDVAPTEQGVLPLSSFMPEEQSALRSAGLVNSYTSSEGATYEAVDPQALWPERQRRAAELAAQPSTVTPEQKRQAIETRAQAYDQAAIDNPDRAEEYRAKAAEIRGQAQPVEAKLNLSIDPAQYKGKESTPAVFIGGQYFTGASHAEALDKAVRQFGLDSPEIQAFDQAADPLANIGIIKAKKGFVPGITGGAPGEIKAELGKIREARTPAAEPPPPLPIDRTERQFSPSELKVDARRFQFKEGGDAAGVTERLKGVKRWDPIKSGVTLVWEDLKGDFYIADGHQRHGLASRLEAEGQSPKIRAVVLREADGVTAEDARAIAAAKNIAEGTGNAIDAAKILRSRPDMAVDLPPTSALVRDAQGLANLSEDAFGMVVNKKVPPGYAAQVGRLAPDPKTHAQLLELLAKEQPDNAIEAESMIRDALDAPAVQSTMEDMFGSAEVTQILFKERAQVLSAAATAIRKDRAAFATLVKEEARLTGAGNQLATASNAERASQDAEILATLQAQARRKGPVADALAAAAKQLHDGGNRAAVVRGFLDELRRQSAPTGADRGSPGGAGRPSETGIAARLEPPAGPEYPIAPRSEWYSDANFEQTGGRMVYMTPDEYLAQVRPLAIDEVARENIDLLKQHILEGKTLDPLAIYKNGKEDGRHRAIAAKELGIAEVPVLTWDSGIAFARRPAQTGPGLFAAEPAQRQGGETSVQRAEPKLSPSMERLLTLASGKLGAPDNILGDQINEATRLGWVTANSGYTATGNRKTRYFLTDKGREALAAQQAPGLELGADNRPQLVIPGAGKISDKKLAEMRAAAPLRPTRAQKPMDTGLFGSEADQQGFAFSAPNHPPAVVADVARAFFSSQPDRSLDDLYGGILQARQTELADVGRQIAEELGITFKDPGIKKRATAEEKVGRKGYKGTQQLTDLVRGGFMVTHPEQADALVQSLARHFSVLDEGWGRTPEGYFDRKVAVRFYDGTIGEIQVWEPQLFDAKVHRGGTELYTKARSMPAGPERDALIQQMIDLYQPITQALPPVWAEAVGKGGNVPKVLEKNSRQAASSGITRPESPTSAGLTSVQPSPGASTAKATGTDQSAGRNSQFTNSNTETSSQPTPGPGSEAAQVDNLSQGMAFARRPQPQGTMPMNRPQGGTVAQAAAPAAPRLEDISAELASLTGAPVRQGRLQRAPKGGGKVAGQYDRGQGVIRLREMSDFETQTHETAHSLETEWGRSLNTIKLAHTAELEPLAYSGADPRQQLSEGFAEWFRYYVTTPNYARSQAPGFTQAFEELLRQRDPKQLAGIQRIAQAYQAHVTAPSRSAVRGDVVSTRSGGAVSDFLKESRKEGIRATLAGYASTAYTTLVDKLNPISKAVDELAKIYEKRTGQALDLKAAQDPYRMARLLQDSYSAGHMDLVHGVVPYHGVTPEGPGLSDALAVALGDTWMGWDDELAADFASYMISRRAVREYDRYLAGEIPNPPGKFTKGDYQVTIAELEAQHPRWAQAADMVYEWQRNMLRKKYEAGFIPQDLYDELLQRPDYVPFMRDLTDLDREVSADANRTLRNSIIKAFKGSKRSIINPIESMMTDAYHTAALIRRNDVFKALEDLARTAGPGAGAIAERIPSSQLTGSKINVSDVLKAAGKEAGLNPGDVDSLTSLVDSLLGDNATGTIFRAGDINEKGEPIVYVWRDGKKHALRLADGDFGRELYDAMTGMNKEARDLFTAVLSVPSTVLRYSITTSPPFVLANYIRDQISAWVLSGERFIPFLSGAAGLRDEIMQREITQIYNTFGGIMGGANVAALDKGRVKRDLRALAKKGYAVKRFAGINGFAQFTELTETGTRLGIFKAAMERGRKQGLSDYEAAVEAAFQARDYIDFGRHGSRTHAARRLVTFLNASVQGLDKTFRVLTGEGAIRKAITPFINQKAGRPLSPRDKANLGRSAKAWAGLTAIGVFGLGLTALYRDDPEYEEISDYLRATHWMVKKGPGEWYAIPKPFELGFVSNLFERGFEAVYKRNPVAMESFVSGLYDVTAPPAVVPIFDVGYQLAHNVDSFGRPIVGQDIAGYEPWRQYTAQTSEIAKSMGYATNTSPAMIDHAIQGFGASWGKIITDISRDKGQERSAADIATGALTRRFIKQETSGSVSSKAFWDQMSESSGPLTQAANTYKDLLDTQGPAAADAFLETKDENTKAYALLTGNFKAAEERLHPMRRAKDAISAISALRRELASNRVTAVESKNEEDPEILTFTPDQRQGAQELLARLAMVEARNALITTGITGFAQKDYMDAESLRKDIAELAPQLGEELNARYEKKHVYDDLYVREVWPDVKNRLLEDRQDADLSDLTAGAE